MRARKLIQSEDIKFEIPQGAALPERTAIVLRVVYLIFNEGFHSGDKQLLIREDLCGEAMRLCRILIENEFTRVPDVYALFALCCFNASRLKSRMSDDFEVISLEHQDRGQWDKDLIVLGNRAMNRAVQTEEYSTYHYEAAIASEHLGAKSYADTNWHRIYRWYTCLEAISPSPLNQLSMAIAQLPRGETEDCKAILQRIEAHQLGQRVYLYHGVWAEYYFKIESHHQALSGLDEAISLVTNVSEKTYLEKRRAEIIGDNS